ncbi:hypothetical protein [Tenacibaculum aiptasiae]|uniref:hypothetical protein n=1 Tax=Tenacibaculum aiptasiae TaxID=426481 RepID=UPI00232FCF00|nr:hypothetical protein [Tenacibaculum aiptasiae]
MKRIIFILMILNLTYVSSQKQIGSFNPEIENSSKNIQKSFSIFNKYTDNISTFLFKKKSIYAYLLNKDFHDKKKLVLKGVKPKYNVIIGKLYDRENNYTLILSNNERSKFILAKFLFNAKKTIITESNFGLKNLRFLQSINKGNKVHLLFLNEKNSTIISRNYHSNGKATSTKFNFQNEKFLITDIKEISFKKLLVDYTKPNHREIENIAYELTKINEIPYKNEIVYKSFSTTTKRNQTSPTSIDLTSRLSKLYVNNNNVIITLDKNRFYTQILTLNIDKGTYSFQKIKKPLFSVKKMYKRSNSFIHNDLLFQVAVSKNILTFTIYDIKKEQLLKEITAKSNNPINFKNTPILQEGGAFEKHRDLEKTNKFLRKISQSNIGIGVMKNKNSYEIVIGSSKLASKGINTVSTILGAALMSGAPNFIDTNNFSQVSFNSYASYLTTKSVRIHCLFDENFNHLSGTIEKNLYDKITRFIKPILSNEKDGIYENVQQKIEVPIAFDVFKTNNSTILGSYLPLTKKYSYYKFN